MKLSLRNVKTQSPKPQKGKDRKHKKTTARGTGKGRVERELAHVIEETSVEMLMKKEKMMTRMTNEDEEKPDHGKLFWLPAACVPVGSGWSALQSAEQMWKEVSGHAVKTCETRDDTNKQLIQKQLKIRSWTNISATHQNSLPRKFFDVSSKSELRNSTVAEVFLPNGIKTVGRNGWKTGGNSAKWGDLREAGSVQGWFCLEKFARNIFFCSMLLRQVPGLPITQRSQSENNGLS